MIFFYKDIIKKNNSIMSEDTYERVKQIAENGIESGRYPLDSGGMDTDDEIWIDENPQYIENVENIYKELLEEKNKTKNKTKNKSKVSEKN